jgi:very-short-patch-repair endonuclease
MMVMNNLSTFIEKAKSLHGDTYDYSKFIYKNANTKGTIICKIHGDFEQTPYHHTNGSGCRKCGFRKTASGVKLSQEQAISNMKKKHNSVYDYSKFEYVSSKTKSTIVCKIHGDFQQSYNDHLRGSGCSMCGKIISLDKRKKPVSIGIQDIVNKNKEFDYEIDYSTVIDYSSKITITCPKHGTFEKSLSACRKTIFCPKCSKQNDKNVMSFSTFVKKAKAVHGDKYTYVSYKGSKIPSEIICKQHGTFLQRPNDHLMGSGCLKCSNKISNEEDLLYKRFSNFKRNNKSIIKPWHIDLFDESLGVGVEVNGAYWHSEEKGKDANYHLNKTKLAKEKGVNLLHFWDFEINEKFEIVSSMISSKLKLNKKIYAKNTCVKEVDKKHAVSFLKENHLQGSCGFSHATGLYVDNELVMLTVFGKPRFSKECEFELIRMCSTLNTSVVGGFSKLLKFFVNKHNVSSIISYADMRYSDGNAYLKNNFEFSHQTKPNYFWIGNNKKLPRYKTQKHKLNGLLKEKFNPQLSETENMTRAGFSKVYDCGNLVYIWKNHPKVVFDN